MRRLMILLGLLVLSAGASPAATPETSPGAAPSPPAFSDAPRNPLLLSMRRADADSTGAFNMAMLGDAFLPNRPKLRPVPRVDVPASFCSLDERNTFHDRVYIPARDVAYANDTMAGDYIARLEHLRGEYQRAGKGFYQVVVLESQDYKRVADHELEISDQYFKLFDAIMKIPVKACPALPEG